MRKRAIALFATGTILAGLLAGCGSSSAGTAASSDSAAQASSTSSEAATTAATAAADGSSAASGDKRTITIATSGNPRPYTYQAEDGTLTGYNIELTKALFNLLPQYDISIEMTEFDSCLTGLSAGRYQLVANNLGYNDERSKLYIYEGPLNKRTSVVVTKGDAVTSLTDIGNGLKTEGEPQIAETGYLEAYYDAHGFDKNNISYTEKQPAQQYQDLEDGTVDYLLSSLESFNAYTEEFGFTDLNYYYLSDDENNELTKDLKLPYVYYCFNTDEEQLANEVADAMRQYKESGDWAKLTEQWFGQDVSPNEEDINVWNYTNQ